MDKNIYLFYFKYFYLLSKYFCYIDSPVLDTLLQINLGRVPILLHVEVNTNELLMIVYFMTLSFSYTRG